MKPTIKQFKELSNAERLEVIKALDPYKDATKIIKYLTSVDLASLDSPLLSQLARAYNNEDDFSASLEVAYRIPEADRDLFWYYRTAFSYIQGYSYAVCDEADKEEFSLEKLIEGFVMLNKVLELSDDKEEHEEWCMEILYQPTYKYLIALYKDDIPLLAELFARREGLDLDEIALEMQGAIAKDEEVLKETVYLDITTDDIKYIITNKSSALYDLTEPLWSRFEYSDDRDVLFASLSEFTPEQKHLFIYYIYTIFIHNYGHQYFLTRNHGIFWRDLPAVFKFFGLEERAKAFKELTEALGGNLPDAQEKREDYIEALLADGEKGKAIKEFLTKADEDFLAEIDDVTAQVLTYVYNYPQPFTFSGEISRLVNEEEEE